MIEDILFLAKQEDLLQACYEKTFLNTGTVVLSEEFLMDSGQYPSCKYLFSTWSMPSLTEAQIEKKLPNLKALFFAAGSVQSFARPFFKHNVQIYSAWAANAVAVAEWAAAQILLANKGYFQLPDRYRNEGFQAARDYSNLFPGNYKTKVGLLGAGMIGRRVIQLLSSYDLQLLVNDPFLSDQQADELKVQKADIVEIFSTCQTVSNHLAHNEATKGMLNRELFSCMKDGSTFINTGRGQTVNLEDLKSFMREHPLCTALLDVTDPTEPLSEEDEIFTLSNIRITPHRAGSSAGEILRLGAYMQEEYKRLIAGEPCLYEVTEAMLETMA